MKSPLDQKSDALSQAASKSDKCSKAIIRMGDERFPNAREFIVPVAVLGGKPALLRAACIAGFEDSVDLETDYLTCDTELFRQYLYWVDYANQDLDARGETFWDDCIVLWLLGGRLGADVTQDHIMKIMIARVISNQKINDKYFQYLLPDQSHVNSVYESTPEGNKLRSFMLHVYTCHPCADMSDSDALPKEFVARVAKKMKSSTSASHRSDSLEGRLKDKCLNYPKRA